MKKDFACNGNIVKDTEMGEIIQLQGDQRAKVCEFMISQLGLQKKNIKIHGFWIFDFFVSLLLLLSFIFFSFIMLNYT